MKKYSYTVVHAQFIAHGRFNIMTSFRIGNQCKVDMEELFKTIDNGVSNIDLGDYQKVISGKKLESVFKRLTREHWYA